MTFCPSVGTGHTGSSVGVGDGVSVGVDDGSAVGVGDGVSVGVGETLGKGVVVGEHAGIPLYCSSHPPPIVVQPPG